MRHHREACVPLVAAVNVDDQVYRQVAAHGRHGIAASAVHMAFSDSQRKDVGRSLERFVTSKCFEFKGGFYYLRKARATPPAPAATKTEPPPAAKPNADAPRPNAPAAPALPTSEPAAEPPAPGIHVCKKCHGTFPADRMYLFCGKPTSVCRDCNVAARRAAQAKPKQPLEHVSSPVAAPVPQPLEVVTGEQQIVVRPAGITLEFPGIAPLHLSMQVASDLYDQLRAVLARVA